MRLELNRRLYSYYIDLTEFQQTIDMPGFMHVTIHPVE